MLEFSRVKYGGYLDEWMGMLTIAIDRCSACGHHWYREQPDRDSLSAMYAAGRFLLAPEAIRRAIRPR